MTAASPRAMRSAWVRDPHQAWTRHAERILGMALPVTLDNPFEELGLDGLYLTEISVGVLTELEVYVPMADLAQAKTLGDFIALLRAALV